MSRAFVKELDGADADNDLPERPLSPHPQYVTPRGLRKLNAEFQQLRGQREQLLKLGDDMTAQTKVKQVERDLRYIERCVQSAILVDAARQPHDEARFGAAVDVLDESGKTYHFTI